MAVSLKDWSGLLLCLEKYRNSSNWFDKQLAESFSSVLSTKSFYAKILRDWLQANAREGVGVNITEWYWSDVELLNDWEAEAWLLVVTRFAGFECLDAWEKASDKDREAHVCKIANLARQLAEVLEQEIRPYYPPVLEYFDDEPSLDIIRKLKPRIGVNTIEGTGYVLSPSTCADRYLKTGAPGEFVRDDFKPDFSDVMGDEPAYSKICEDGKQHDFFPLWRTPASALSSLFLAGQPQRVESVLRRLADYAELQSKKEKRDKRPFTGNANARVFAKELAWHFKTYFNKTPNEVIAACVILKFPSIEPVPNGEQIRKWRGMR